MSKLTATATAVAFANEFAAPLVLQGGAAAPASKGRTKLPLVNGVAHPKPGTRCAQIWAWCDQQRANNVHPTVKAARAALAQLDPTTVQVQYYRYRKYHGYSAPAATPAAAPVTQG